MAYITFQPKDYFNTKLYTGNGSTNAITGVGFQPDWVWIKNASSGSNYDHVLYDAVRGVTKNLHSNTTDVEDTQTDGLTAFGTDGFTVGADTKSNSNGSTLVSWNWKAGNSSGSSNSDGSITSTVSANTTAGFSIVKYTGNESGAPKTVGHGLGVAPKVIIIKRLNDSINWGVYHESLGNTKVIFLNTTGAETTSSAYWGDTTPTSSVFTINGNHTVNHTGSDFIAYCFAEKTGFSKFGSYTGSGSDLFIYTGFKPALMICKKTDSTDNWKIVDNKRSPFNVMDDTLAADTSNAEASPEGGVTIDFLSNGFAFKSMSNAAFNANGGSYIYMAFAEEPLVSSNNIPATAR
jgi:hypothetical protein